MKINVIKFDGAQIQATVVDFTFSLLQARMLYIDIFPPLAPQFKAVVLIKYGVVKAVNHAKKKPTVMATPKV